MYWSARSMRHSRQEVFGENTRKAERESALRLTFPMGTICNKKSLVENYRTSLSKHTMDDDKIVTKSEIYGCSFDQCQNTIYNHSMPEVSR